VVGDEGAAIGVVGGVSAQEVGEGSGGSGGSGAEDVVASPLNARRRSVGEGGGLGGWFVRNCWIRGGNWARVER